MIAKKLPADFSHADSLERLWTIHDRLTIEYYGLEKQLDNAQLNPKELQVPKKYYLDLKIEIARRTLNECYLCSHKCGANRIKGELGRFCRCGSQMSISIMFPHMGEEPELVLPGTVFTLGCTMRCKHCQNWTISQWLEESEVYTPELLAKEVENLRNGGCRNVNLVGGDPTP